MDLLSKWDFWPQYCVTVLKHSRLAFLVEMRSDIHINDSLRWISTGRLNAKHPQIEVDSMVISCIKTIFSLQYQFLINYIINKIPRHVHSLLMIFA